MFVGCEKLLPLNSSNKAELNQQVDNNNNNNIYFAQAVPIHARLGSLIGSWLWPHHVCNAYIDGLVGGHGHLVG